MLFYALYFMSSVLIAVALGLLVMTVEIQSVPQTAKFFLGVSITPFVIGNYMIVLSFIPGSDNKFVRVWVPVLVAIAVIICNRKILLNRCRRKTFSAYVPSPSLLWTAIVLSSFFVCFIASEFLKGQGSRGRVQAPLAFLTGTICYCLLYLACFKLKNWHKNVPKNIVTIACMAMCSFSWTLSSRVSLVYTLFWIAGMLLITGTGYAILIAAYKRKYAHNADRELKVYFQKRYLQVGAWLGMVFVGVNFPWLIRIFNRRYVVAFLKRLTNKLTDSAANNRIVLYMLAVCLAGLGVLAILLLEKLLHRLLSFVYGEAIPKERVWKCMTIVVLVITGVFFFNNWFHASCAPVIGSDAVEYLGQAFRFAQEGTASSMTTFVDAADGATLMCTHNFTWPAYLANALLYSPRLGYPHDHAARLAFQMSYLYFFAAVIATGQLVFSKNKHLYSALTITACLTCNGFGLTLTAGSRDIFRLTPLLGFFCVLYGLENEASKEDCLHFGATLLMPFILGYCTMAGHPINAFSAIIIVFALFLTQLINKKWNVRMIPGYCAAAAGGLLGSYMMVWAFLKTGSLSGNRGDLHAILDGSEYYANYLRYQKTRLRGNTSYILQALEILFRNNIVLSIMGILGAAWLVISWIKKTKHKQDSLSAPVVAMSLTCLLHLLMLNNVVSWGGEKMCEWLVMNQRYTLQFPLFMAFSAVLSLPLINCVKDSQNSKSNSIICRVKSICVFELLVFMLLINVLYYSSTDSYSGHSKMLIGTQVANEIFQGERFLMDNYCTNYYCYNRGVSIFTEYAQPCLMAKTPQELESAMKKMDLQGGMLKVDFENVYWNDTSLEKLLHSEQTEIVFEDDYYIIFRWKT